MKKLLLILALAGGISLLNAQTLEFKVDNKLVTNGETITVSGDVDNETTFYLKAHFFVKNTSAAAIKIAGSKTDVSIPEGSTNSWCGFNNCWASNTMPEIDMPAGSTSVELGQGEDGGFYGEYFPGESKVPALIKYTFYVVGNESDKIEFTIKYAPTSDTTPVSKETFASAAKRITAYPNPAREQVSFKFNLEKNVPARLVLRSISGLTVKTLDVTGRTEAQVSVDGLSRGLYFYSIEQNNKSVAVGKLMVN